MNFNILSKPPTSGDSKEMYRWYYRIAEILNGLVSVALDHVNLQNVLQADPTLADTTGGKHVTNAQMKVVTDHSALLSDDTTTGTIPANVTNTQVKKYEDHRLTVGNPHSTLFTDLADAATTGAIVYTDTKDPTGWVDSSLITVTYNDADDTITLTGTLDYYWRGVKKSLTSPWTSTAHSATTGVNYYLYSTDGTTFAWSTTIWAFSDLMVAAVQHGVTDLWAIREVHGMMPWQSHEDAHRTHGTYKQSGGVLDDYTLASTTVAFRRPSVTATVVHDEDIETTIAALPAAGPYTQVTLTGTGTTTFLTTGAEIVPVLVNNPYYNAFATPNWIQTLMANNSYMCVWLVAVPAAEGTESQKYRYLWLQGQSNGTLVAQQALVPSDLNLGQLTTLSAEFTFIAKVIIRFQGGNWDLTSVTALSGNRAFYVGSVAGAFEPLLGNPAVDGYVLSSTTAGVRSWVASGGGPGAATITQTEVDFGATPLTDKEFTITDAAVSGTSKIMAVPAYEDTTDNTADEVIANAVVCAAGKPAAGSFTLMVASLDSTLTGKYKFNYTVG